MTEDQIEKLNENIETLNKTIEQQVSMRFIILKGVVYGVSSVIGATIVAGIVFMLLENLIDSTGSSSVLDEVIQQVPSEDSPL